MKLEKYQKYKSTNIEWLDEIPKHWEIKRIKNIGTVKARVGWKALKASEYVDSGYFFLSTPNIKHREIDFENVNYITKQRYDEAPEIMLKEGDILLTKDGSTLGTVNIVKYLPAEGTVNSSIAVLRFENGYDKDYIFYQIKSDYLQKVINLKKDGMGVPHLFQRDIKLFHILTPSLREQKQISKYLGKQMLLIDNKIALLSQKIESYKRLYLSLLNETVRKGLEKKIKYKRSGITWIGEIPNNWSVQRISSVFTEQNEKVNDTDYPPLSVTKNGIVPQLSNAAKTNYNDNRRRVDIGDFVINSRSDRRGSSGLSTYKGSVSVINIVLKPNKSIDGNYYHFLFKSFSFTEEFYKQGKGIVADLWSTRYSIMRNIQIPIPSKKEQIKIAKYLNHKTEIINKIIQHLEIQVQNLKDFKKALLNDVITGKLKVSQD